MYNTTTLWEMKVPKLSENINVITKLTFTNLKFAQI